MANSNEVLREALIKARSAICHFARYQCDSLSWENSNIQANCGDVLCSWRGLCDAKTAINAALSAPARNCDVGTLTEQQQMFHDFCEKMQHTDKACCGGCPIVHLRMQGVIDNGCELAWAQMPYRKGGVI